MKEMNFREWEALRRADPSGYLRRYRAFMFAVVNSHDCEHCPENREMEDGGHLPCGQFHCWVDVSNEEEE
jgi:hypothetical protein